MVDNNARITALRSVAGAFAIKVSSIKLLNELHEQVPSEEQIDLG